MARLLALYALLVVTVLLLGPPGVAARAASLFYDDGFYYLRIAQHIAAGDGSTFDGLNPTNGYHPLWLLLLVPAATLAPSPTALLLAALALQMIAVALAAGLAYRLARHALPPMAAALVGFLWLAIQCTYWAPWSGLEHALQSLLVLLLLDRYAAWSIATTRARPSSPAVLGLVAALTALARLDNLLLVALLAVALLLRQRRQGRSPWRPLAAFMLPVVATTAAYGLFNLYAFGHPLPVSGAIKARWSAALLAADPLYRAHGWWAAKAATLLEPLRSQSLAFALPLLLGSLGALLLVPMLLRLLPGVRALPGLLPVTLFSGLQCLFYVTIYHDGFSFQPWYFVVQPWLAAFLTATFIDRLRHQARRTAKVLLLLLLATAALYPARSALLRRQRQADFSADHPHIAATNWVATHTSADVVLGAWNAGMISFLAQRQVVNLDGLVNSWAYERQERLDFCAYADRLGITLLVDVFDRDQPFALLDHEMAGPDAGCQQRLTRVWSGPAFPGSRRHAMAFRLEAVAFLQDAPTAAEPTPR